MFFVCKDSSIHIFHTYSYYFIVTAIHVISSFTDSLFSFIPFSENLDLDAHELVLPGSGNDLESLNNIQFSFHYKIKKVSQPYRTETFNIVIYFIQLNIIKK